jgi:hypothetical protein
MTRRVAAALLISFVLVAAPVSAIIWAGPDGERHPYVGIAVFLVDGQQSHFCSGTLLSPTVFLTAGHCTVDTDSLAYVSFDTAIPGATGFVTGEPFTHPDYDTGFPNTRDVGVIVLDEPVVLDEYGVLPELGAIDAFATQRGQQNQLFTIVGYGDQAIVPKPAWEPVRYFGTPQLVTLDSALTGGFNIQLSGNNGRRAAGGACFGDSGGPALVGDSNVVAGVGSFVLNYNCTGASLYYRVDTEDAQSFILSFLE